MGVQEEVIQNTEQPKNCAAASRNMLRFITGGRRLAAARGAVSARAGSRMRSHWINAMAAAMHPTVAVAPRHPTRWMMAAATIGPLTLPRP